MRHPVIPASAHYSDTFVDPKRWKAFAPRRDDIVVSSPLKSGTTWTQSIVALLLTGDEMTDAKNSINSPWIDLKLGNLAEVMEQLEAEPGRRRIKTHTPLDGIPFWPDLRYVTVYRHPIDVYFSLRPHAANTEDKLARAFYPAEYFSDDPAEGFHVFLEQDLFQACSLSTVVRHFEATRKRERSGNVLRLHYADMTRDLGATFEQVAAHLGTPHPRPRMKRLVQAATFDSMKANADRFAPNAGRGFWKSDTAFFDSGTSGKWVGRLSSADLAAYETRIKDLLPLEDREWLEFGETRRPALGMR